MLFNSLEFFLFFPVVYLLYVVLPHRWQNRMLLAASYIFYGSWDWRFLSLILISTIIDYGCGIRLSREERPRYRKRWLALSISVNLGILAFFKYFNFFAENLQSLLALAGWQADMRLLHIVLPVGISFYTFQTMSYTIDVYRRKMDAVRSFPDFALFVAYFPQLVAGPIERAKELLPQIVRPRKLNFERFSEGCYLILWGFFQKVFVADNLAAIVEPVFASSGPYHLPQVLLGVYAFAFQIFCDFAGYSNIARGLAKMMGIDIMVNFNLPYFATNPSEFWQRWHISLSSWLRDYLYIPLGGNRGGTLLTFRNLTLTMLLGGLWHGAAWTFVVWGAYHGLLLAGHRMMAPALGKVSGRFRGLSAMFWKLANVIVFFHLICYGWLFFRSGSFAQAASMTEGLFRFDSSSAFSLIPELVQMSFFIFPLLLIQVFQYLRDDLLVIFRIHWFFQGIIYFVLLFLTVVFGAGGAQEFIYFQF